MTPIHPPRPIVVKIGGGLLAHAALDALLAVPARRGAVVAPGGGPFADAVREAQATLGFSDAAAHRAAIHAMEQAAIAIADRAPDLRPCATPADFARAAAERRGALWFPARMALEADVPESWDVTSDSLALWLAITLGASGVTIVKAAPPVAGGPKAWAKAGLVDAHFPTLAGVYAGAIALVGDACPRALDAALARSARSAA